MARSSRIKASIQMFEAFGGARRLVASIGPGGSGEPVASESSLARMRQRWSAPRTDAGPFIRCLGLVSAASAVQNSPRFALFAASREPD